MASNQIDLSLLSPSAMCMAGQDRIEPVLLRHARKLGADIRFATEVVDLFQDSEGVDVRLRDRTTNAETNWRARYVIAADGTRSSARERLGIAAPGRTISHNLSILFESDLSFLEGRGFCLYYLQNPAFAGAFVTTDDVNRGQISVEYDPSRETLADFTPERCAAIVRAALGLPDAPVTVLDAMGWEMATKIAERMRTGNIFLAGDAAHTMPPTGGLGGQTAMQDAADLAWKLALVLGGQADPALLDTYEAERLPVARLTVARQTAHYVERMRPDRTDLDGDDAEKDYLAVACGYRYRSAAIQDDPADTGAPAESPLHASFRPGTRLPHVGLRRDGERISTFDLIAEGFVLIAGTNGARWVAATAQMAAGGSPITVCRLGADLVDEDGALAQRAGLTPDGAVLIRPDGFIAWRFDAAHADPLAALERALARALCRQPPLLAKAA